MASTAVAATAPSTSTSTSTAHAHTMTLDPKYDDFDYPTTSLIQQTGHPGHTTKEQDAQVQQLRMMLEAEAYKERLDTLTLVSRASSQGYMN